MKYIRKPEPIEAIQYLGDNKLEVFEFVKEEGEARYSYTGKGLFIFTIDDVIRVSIGDYIIRDNDNNYYTLNQKTFEELYQPDIK